MHRLSSTKRRGHLIRMIPGQKGVVEFNGSNLHTSGCPGVVTRACRHHYSAICWNVLKHVILALSTFMRASAASGHQES